MRRSRPDRSGARRRRLAEGLLLLCAVVVAVGVAVTHRSAPVPVAAAAAPSAAASSSLGHTVYLRDCAWCHGTDGGGSGRAPSLKTDGPADADFWLRTGRMPLTSADAKVKPGPPAYDPKTLDALVSYVGSLGTGEQIPRIAPGDKAIGESLFISNCAPCHSSSGTGMILPDGTWAPTLFSTPPKQIAEAVRIGPGQMPRFGKKTMDEEELNGLVSYVSDLGSPQVIGGHPLDQLGPIAEGIFFFLLPLPLLVVVIRLLGKKAP
jgi:quinol---cytochrome-c reductase cytochrome c subunit